MEHKKRTIKGETYYQFDESEYEIFIKIMENKENLFEELDMSSEKITKITSYLSYLVQNLRTILAYSTDDQIYDLVVLLMVGTDITSKVCSNFVENRYTKEDVDRLIENLEQIVIGT